MRFISRYIKDFYFSELSFGQGINVYIFFLQEKKDLTLKIGIEYPINKFIINAGIWSLYFPDIVRDQKIIFCGCM
jgi:hypothetical protein